MRIVKVTIGKRLTLNLGNFNSVQIHCELDAEVEEGDDPDEVKTHLLQMVDSQIEKELDQYES